jgi:hypothetical protein
VQQTPWAQKLVWQSSPDVHAVPFAPFSVQIPVAAQLPLVHWSPAEHVVWSGCFGIQAPTLQ